MSHTVELSETLMDFFILNLFGHDPNHDLHPGHNLGQGRVAATLVPLGPVHNLHELSGGGKMGLDAIMAKGTEITKMRGDVQNELGRIRWQLTEDLKVEPAGLLLFLRQLAHPPDTLGVEVSKAIGKLPDVSPLEDIFTLVVKANNILALQAPRAVPLFTQLVMPDGYLLPLVDVVRAGLPAPWPSLRTSLSQLGAWIEGDMQLTEDGIPIVPDADDEGKNYLLPPNELFDINAERPARIVEWFKNNRPNFSESLRILDPNANVSDPPGLRIAYIMHGHHQSLPSLIANALPTLTPQDLDQFCGEITANDFDLRPYLDQNFIGVPCNQLPREIQIAALNAVFADLGLWPSPFDLSQKLAPEIERIQTIQAMILNAPVAQYIQWKIAAAMHVCNYVATDVWRNPLPPETVLNTLYFMEQYSQNKKLVAWSYLTSLTLAREYIEELVEGAKYDPILEPIRFSVVMDSYIQPFLPLSSEPTNAYLLQMCKLAIFGVCLSTQKIGGDVPTVDDLAREAYVYLRSIYGEANPDPYLTDNLPRVSEEAKNEAESAHGHAEAEEHTMVRPPRIKPSAGKLSRQDMYKNQGKKNLASIEVRTQASKERQKAVRSRDATARREAEASQRKEHAVRWTLPDVDLEIEGFTAHGDYVLKLMYSTLIHMYQPVDVVPALRAILANLPPIFQDISGAVDLDWFNLERVAEDPDSAGVFYNRINASIGAFTLNTLLNTAGIDLPTLRPVPLVPNLGSMFEQQWSDYVERRPQEDLKPAVLHEIWKILASHFGLVIDVIDRFLKGYQEGVKKLVDDVEKGIQPYTEEDIASTWENNQMSEEENPLIRDQVGGKKGTALLGWNDNRYGFQWFWRKLGELGIPLDATQAQIIACMSAPTACVWSANYLNIFRVNWNPPRRVEPQRPEYNWYHNLARLMTECIGSVDARQQNILNRPVEAFKLVATTVIDQIVADGYGLLQDPPTKSLSTMQNYFKVLSPNSTGINIMDTVDADDPEGSCIKDRALWRGKQQGVQDMLAQFNNLRTAIEHFIATRVGKSPQDILAQRTRPENNLLPAEILALIRRVSGFGGVFPSAKPGARMNKLAAFETQLFVSIRFALVFVLYNAYCCDAALGPLLIFGPAVKSGGYPKWGDLQWKISFMELPNMIEIFTRLNTNLILYISALREIVSLLTGSDTLNPVQKLNSEKVMGAVTKSLLGAMSCRQVPGGACNNPSETLLRAQQAILEELIPNPLSDVASGPAHRARGAAKLDTKLYNQFVLLVSTDTTTILPGKIPSRYVQSNFVQIPKSQTLLEMLYQAKTGDSLPVPLSQILQKLKRYYVNNAVNIAPDDLGLVGKTFCPNSSIADAMSNCAFADAEIDKREVGSISVMIRTASKNTFFQLNTSTSGDRRAIRITANLQIKGVNVISITRANPIEVDLTIKNSPLSASTTYKTLSKLISNKFAAYSLSQPGITAAASWQQLYTEIDTSPDLRRELLEASFTKALGDFMQELNVTIVNGGYKGIPYISPGVLPFDGDGNALRLGLSNDRPSGVRIALLLLYGKDYGKDPAINQYGIGGFITGKSVGQNKEMKYLIASAKPIVNWPNIIDAVSRAPFVGGSKKPLSKRRPKRRRQTKRSKQHKKRRTLRHRRRRRQTRHK